MPKLGEARKVDQPSVSWQIMTRDFVQALSTKKALTANNEDLLTDLNECSVSDLCF